MLLRVGSIVLIGVVPWNCVVVGENDSTAGKPGVNPLGVFHINFDWFDLSNADNGLDDIGGN